MERIAALVAGAVLVAVTAQAGPSAALSNTTCQGDIALIRARGSGDPRALDADLNRPEQAGNSGRQLTLDAASKVFRQRASQAGKSVNEYDLVYPALSTGTLKADLTPARVFNSQYRASIATGIENLRTVLNAKKGCPSQAIVLTGYSQGAYVVGDVLAALPAGDRGRIAGALLFGDPRFDPADPAARGSYESKRYGLAAPVVGKRQVGVGYGSRVRNYCYSEDLICQGLNLYQHGSWFDEQRNAHARGYACNGLPTDDACRKYVDLGGASMARDGGTWLADLLGLRVPAQSPSPTPTQTDVIAFPAPPRGPAGLVMIGRPVTCPTGTGGEQVAFYRHSSLNNGNVIPQGGGPTKPGVAELPIISTTVDAPLGSHTMYFDCRAGTDIATIERWRVIKQFPPIEIVLTTPLRPTADGTGMKPGGSFLMNDANGAARCPVVTGHTSRVEATVQSTAGNGTVTERSVFTPVRSDGRWGPASVPVSDIGGTDRFFASCVSDDGTLQVNLDLVPMLRQLSGTKSAS